MDERIFRGETTDREKRPMKMGEECLHLDKAVTKILVEVRRQAMYEILKWVEGGIPPEWVRERVQDCDWLPDAYSDYVKQLFSLFGRSGLERKING